MNEKRIQELLEIEKQAQQILQSAVHEAEQVPAAAEREAQELIQSTRESARREAQEIIQKAQADDVMGSVMSKMQDKIRKSQEQAATNLERAVAYVLERVAGAE